MSFPMQSLIGEHRELGLVVALFIGFGFGFVLERAGFGRASKLAAQFYLFDMTVFKVMFGAIVTAMLGIVVLSGVGVLDLTILREGAATGTFVWPMLLGGLMLGAGFIISGYCPGTSLVATASGNYDGLLTVVGVLIGSVLYAETFPLLQSFHNSGKLGLFFLDGWLGVSPVFVAVGITVIAVGAFFGAEKVEKIMTRRVQVAADVVDEAVRSAPAPRRFVFGLYGAVAVGTLLTLFVATAPSQAHEAQHGRISAEALARAVFDEPWHLSLIDLRPAEQCAESRVPGARCVPAETLGDLGLEYSPGARHLILVGDVDLAELPEAVRKYKGRVSTLEGGWPAWKAYALDAPVAPEGRMDDTEREAFQFRTAVHSALTGVQAAPASAAPVQTFTPKPRKKGGCG